MKMEGFDCIDVLLENLERKIGEALKEGEYKKVKMFKEIMEGKEGRDCMDGEVWQRRLCCGNRGDMINIGRINIQVNVNVSLNEEKVKKEVKNEEDS